MVGLLAGWGHTGRQKIFLERVEGKQGREKIGAEGRGKIGAEGRGKIGVRYTGGYGLDPTPADFTSTIPNLYPLFTLPILYLLHYHFFTFLRGNVPRYSA